MKTLLKISKDFTDTPGPRFRVEGEFSGEEFRETQLGPLYVRCKAAGDTILVDLDDTEGYATSFLEEAFGGLRREHPNDNILSVIEIKCDDEPFLSDEVKKCVDEALG
jgi:hypothetical protein